MKKIITLFTILFLVISNIIAQSTGGACFNLNKSKFSSSSSVARGIARGDLNNDGITDLVVSNSVLEVYLGTPGGGFMLNQSINPMSFSFGFEHPITLFDFDNNGTLDIVAVSTNYRKFAIYFGAGNGSFVITNREYDALLYNTSIINSIEVADFNNDGTRDVAVTSASNLAIFNGPFATTILGSVTTIAASQTVNLISSAWTARASDFNQDGYMDFVSSRNGSVMISYGNSASTFTNTVNYAFGGASGRLILHDFNNDGKQDIAGLSNFTTAGPSTVAVMLTNTLGGFNAAVSYTGIGLNFGGSIDIGDINGDGKMDLVTCTTGGRVSVLLGSANGTFTNTINYYTGNSTPYAIATGDFNQDNKTDVIVGSYNSLGTSLMLNSGSELIGSTSLELLNTTTNLSQTFADVTGDGRTDLVWKSYNYSGSIYTLSIYPANSAGAILPATFSSTFNAGSGYIASGETAVSDFNGDTYKDIAILTNNDKAIVHFGNAAGNFTNTLNYAPSTGMGYYGTGLSAADMNNDGYGDLIFFNSSYVYYIAYGASTGTLSSPTQVGSYATPYAGNFSVKDLNGDSYPEIVTLARSYVSGFVPNGLNTTTYWGSSAATYSHNVIYTYAYFVDTYPTENPKFGYFNNDTYPDIIYNYYNDANGTDGIAVMYGNTLTATTYGFDSPIAVQNGTYIVNVFTGKFDSDNLDDIVYRTNNNVMLLRGGVNGSGTFTNTPFSIFTSTNNAFFQPGDFNVDSKQDLGIISGVLDNATYTYTRTIIQTLINLAPTVTLSSLTSYCAGSPSLAITASGALSYSWSNGSSGPVANVSPSVNTTYTVLATSYGCTTTAIRSISVQSSPTVTVNSGIVCSGAGFTINPSGAISYTFSNGSNTVAPTANSNYTITGAGSNGCTSKAVSSVSVNPPPVISVNSGSVCGNTSYTITPTGAVSYTYSTGSAVINPSTTTGYVVTGADAIGCTNTVVGFVTVNPGPNIQVASGGVCAGNSFTLNPSGASSYTFSSGSAVVTPSANTSYSISATSANGCTNMAVATVSINTPPVITVSGGLICGGAPYTLMPSGASTYTYSSGSAIVSPTANASYSITGTSAQGCVSSNTAVANLTVSTAPVISVANGTICSGTSFTLTPSGASTYTYSGGSAVVSPSNTTYYTVSGTNSLGCTSNSPAIAIISVVNAPVVTAASGSICQGSSFQLQAFGATSYTYQGGSSVVTPTVSSTYTIIGSSGNGCTSATPAVVNVTVNAIPVISVNSGSVCQGNSFTLTPSGASTYIYSSGSPVVSPFNTSTVSVSGTSSAGCVSQLAAISTITVSSLPFITVTGGAICSGNSFTLSPSGATTYTYSSGSAIVSPTANASYSITGSNAQGCVSSNTAVANLVVNTTPTVTAASGTICEGSSFAITAGGANSYTYSGGSSVVSPTTNSSYTVTGSSNGCVSQAPAIVTVTVFARPVISVNSGSVCAGSSFTLSPSGASTYNYSSGSAVVTPFNTSSYSVSGTSSVGCVSQSAAVANVSVISLPFISVNNGAICSGQTFTMLPSGALTYTYSSGSAVVTPTATSSYSVTGSNAQGCVSSNTAVANVSVGSSPTITAANGTICAGANFILNPSGGTTYTYSGGSAIVTPTANTSYTINGANAIGCISSSPAVVLITVNPTPTIAVNNGVVCSGVPFTITASGASTYTYSSGSPVVSPTVTSYYLVSGTNSFGCVSTNPAAALVTVNSAPVITAPNGLICGGGSFLIQPSGASTYTYSSGSPNVTPTINTTYTVTGTNQAGCVSTSPAIVTVTVESVPVITVNSGSVCAGSNFTLTPSGAATYSYSSGSPVVTPFVNSSYSVTGTSSAGCTSPVVVSQVTVISLPIVNVNSGAICEGKSFTMVPVGALNYTYSGGTAVVSPTITSTYSVTGSDANGCLSANTAISNVTVTPGPTVTASTSNTLICAGESVTLTANGAAQYVWNGTTIATTLAVSPAVPTVYSVKGTDSEGCSGTFTLNQNVSDCTSLADAEKEAVFNLFPNPNNGEFTIVSKGDMTLTLVNEIGQHIQVITLDETNEHKIQLKEIAYGIYFVIGVNNNQIIKQKIIVNK